MKLVFLTMPIAAHATVIRYDEEQGPLHYAGNIGDLRYDPQGATSNDQLVVSQNW